MRLIWPAPISQLQRYLLIKSPLLSTSHQPTSSHGTVVKYGGQAVISFKLLISIWEEWRLRVLGSQLIHYKLANDNWLPELSREKLTKVFNISHGYHMTPVNTQRALMLLMSQMWQMWLMSQDYIKVLRTFRRIWLMLLPILPIFGSSAKIG